MKKILFALLIVCLFIPTSLISAQEPKDDEQFKISVNIEFFNKHFSVEIDYPSKEYLVSPVSGTCDVGNRTSKNITVIWCEEIGQMLGVTGYYWNETYHSLNEPLVFATTDNIQAASCYTLLLLSRDDMLSLLLSCAVWDSDQLYDYFIELGPVVYEQDMSN